MSVGFLSNIPSLVTVELNVGLVKPFSEKEIVDVIWEMELVNPLGRMVSTFISTNLVGMLSNQIFFE